MFKEPELKVGVNVKVATRKFVPDPNGDVIAQDGQKGSYQDWNAQEVHNLLTTAGRDWLHLQGYETTGLSTNGGNYLVLSTDTDGAAVGHTAVDGEITENGLQRAIGTVAHVAGQTTSTIAKTFTASDTHTAVQLAGLLTAASTGTLVHEATFTAVTLENNDQLAVTWTITLS